MKNRKYLYGSLGLFSLLGFIGVFTAEKDFLAFFAFVVNFEYFFMKSDEMLEEYMNKSASRAFYGGMIGTLISILISFIVHSKNASGALMTGFAWGWSIAIIVYALSTAFYGFREKWDLER